MSTSLFEKYGGFSTVHQVVLTLYDRLLKDKDVGPFFDDVDLPSVIDHQTKFVSSLLGGPASFTDEQLRIAHQHMTIENHHFDRLKVVVHEVLSDFKVDPGDIEVIVDQFEARRGLMVE
ncbi:MAG: group 1 truncated hemoglobin [Pseudomonadota bacterium]